ncbi:MAG: dihydropteroate synthase [Paracoccaceae bacterium]|nr:dihydropteroate synthase [Paracoccaceae bacterium]
MTWHEKRDAFLAAMRHRPQVMGILNVTPDSFSDGGEHHEPKEAVAHALRMVAEGADILDVGGESTRPGAVAVSAEDELARVLPVIKSLGALDTPVSVDTYKASVALKGVEAGAVIINDVWGMQKDPEMPAAVADTGAAVVLMHNRAEADETVDIIADMRRFLDVSLSLAAKAGISETRIMVDPGIGFGKTADQSLTCLNHLDELCEWYGLPVLLGQSRKRFIGHVLGAEVHERLTGTLAANMIGLARGARVLRVHDVKEHAEAVKIFCATEGA